MARQAREPPQRRPCKEYTFERVLHGQPRSLSCWKSRCAGGSPCGWSRRASGSQGRSASGRQAQRREWKDLSHGRDPAARQGVVDRVCRNGKRHEESARTKKYTEAETMLKLREGDVAKGVPISPQIGRLSFDDATKDLVTEYTINRRRSLDSIERRSISA